MAGFLKMESMTTIYKYQFDIADKVEVEMPRHAIILSIQVQDNKPTLWAQVETGHQMETRTFRIYGTGHSLDMFATEGKYLQTIQLDGLVWHIFE